MKLEDIMSLAEKELKIDETNLSKASTETPNIYVRFLRLRSNENLILRNFQFEFKKMIFAKREYYLGKAPIEEYKKKPFNLKVMKSEVDHYLDSDDDLIEISKKIEIQTEKVFYLDSVLKQLSNRGFLIKSAIDYQKLMNGGF